MKGKTLYKWAGIITVLLIFSRVLGFLREAAIAYRFGASMEADAYYVAVTLPQILFLAFNDAVKTAFIPVFGEYHREGDGNVFARTTYVILAGILIVASLALVIAAPIVVRIVAPKFGDEAYQLAVNLTRVLVPGLFFMGLVGLSNGVLHTKKKFLMPALTAYPSNIIIMLAAIFLGGHYGIQGLAWATLFAFASQFLILIPSLARVGVFRRGSLHWRHLGLRKMGLLLPPVLLGSAAVELKVIVDRAFGSMLPEGSIALLNYANRIYLLPSGILIIALLTVLYPTLVELRLKDEMEEFKETLRQGFGVIIFIMMPVMAGMLVLRTPLVRVMFERGAFDAAATGDTAFALGFYSLGLVAMGGLLLSNRAFYALKDTVTPMKVTVSMVAVNIFLNWLLIKPLAHGGIALGTALSLNLGTMALLFLLRRRIGIFGAGRLLVTLVKCGFCTLVMSALLLLLVGYLPVTEFIPQAAGLLVLVGLGAAVYLGLAVLLGVEEMKLSMSLLSRRKKQ